MEKNRKTQYYITCFAGVMWDEEYKRWVRMDSDDYPRKNHKGYRSHAPCKTMNRALKLCRSLRVLIGNEEEIILQRFTWPKGRRRIDDFVYTGT